MSYGPWATELGAQLLGLKFRKLLKLEAWRLCLVLGAWSLHLFPVTVFHGPLLMELVNFSAWRLVQGRRILRLGPDISVSGM